MGAELSVTCRVTAAPGIVQRALDSSSLEYAAPNLWCVELRVLHRDAVDSFLKYCSAKQSSGASRPPPGDWEDAFVLVASCTAVSLGIGARAIPAGATDKSYPYRTLRSWLRSTSPSGGRVGLVVDPTVRLGDRLRRSSNRLKVSKGLTLFLASVLSCVDYELSSSTNLSSTYFPFPPEHLDLSYIDLRQAQLGDDAADWLLRELAAHTRHHVSYQYFGGQLPCHRPPTLVGPHASPPRSSHSSSEWKEAEASAILAGRVDALLYTLQAVLLPGNKLSRQGIHQLEELLREVPKQVGCPWEQPMGIFPRLLVIDARNNDHDAPECLA